MSRGTPPSRILRWLALVLLGVVILVGPLVFSDAVARLASDAVAAAQHSPAQVATLIIAALALDVFLPVPNGITNTLAGAVFGFSLGAAVIWTGLMAASLLGYAMGALAGKRLAQRILGADELARAHRFAEDLGPLVLILSRPVPVFAELATLAAGMAGMPMRLFLLLTSLANLAIALVFAGIGALALSHQSAEWAVLGGVLLPLVAWLAYRRWGMGRRR